MKTRKCLLCLILVLFMLTINTGCSGSGDSSDFSSSDSSPSDFTLFQESILDEINYIRTDPSGYAEIRLKSYNDSGTDNGAYTDIRSRSAEEPLELQDQLCSAASKYAQYLAENNVFGHYENGDPAERCEAEGYDYYSGENIGAGSYNYYNAENDPVTAAEAFIVMWVIDMNVVGVGHRENIMSSTHKKLGAGFFRDTDSTYENYAVLDFGYQ
jgi:uncharacterized protein YkwD